MQIFFFFMWSSSVADIFPWWLYLFLKRHPIRRVEEGKWCNMVSGCGNTEVCAFNMTESLRVMPSSLSGSAAPHGDATHYQQTIKASTNVWASGHNQNIMGNKKKPGDSFSLSWHKLLKSWVEETEGRSSTVVWGYPESWKSLLLFSLWKIWQGAAIWGQLSPTMPFCTRQPTSRGGKRFLMSHTLGRHTLVFATTGV